MKWTIKENRFDATYLKIDTEFEPKNDTLRYVLAQVEIINYPEFMLFQSERKSFGEEHVQIKNFADMDWEDKAWAKNVKGSELEAGEVFLIHDVIGETIIKESIFDKILFDYGSKILEVYQLDCSLPEVWQEEMTMVLEKLKAKIDAKNFT